MLYLTILTWVCGCMCTLFTGSWSVLKIATYPEYNILVSKKGNSVGIILVTSIFTQLIWLKYITHTSDYTIELGKKYFCFSYFISDLNTKIISGLYTTNRTCGKIWHFFMSVSDTKYNCTNIVFSLVFTRDLCKNTVGLWHDSYIMACIMSSIDNSS